MRMTKIKEYFSRGKTPTGDQFSQLIDFSVDASELKTGSIPIERLGDVPAENITGKLNKETLPDKLVGDASMLTKLNATNVTVGTLMSEVIPNLDANKITAGKFDNALLPADISVTSYTGEGTGLTQLNADNIASGTLSIERLPLATEIEPGLTQFSNLAETKSGSSLDRAISPKHLAEVLADYKIDIDTTISEVKAGLKFKDNVVAVATSPIDVTAELDTLIMIDTYQLENNDRVLLTQQADDKQNTVWIAKLNSAWEIAEDLDNDIEGEMAIGISVEVTNGDEYASTYWSVTALNNGIVWKKRSDLNDFDAGDGIVINGFTISADLSWVKGQVENTLGDGLIVEEGVINVDKVWLNQQISQQIDELKTNDSPEVSGLLSDLQGLAAKAYDDTQIRAPQKVAVGDAEIEVALSRDTGMYGSYGNEIAGSSFRWRAPDFDIVSGQGSKAITLTALTANVEAEVAAEIQISPNLFITKTFQMKVYQYIHDFSTGVTSTATSFVYGPMTVTGNVNIQRLNYNGLSLESGAVNNTDDSGEFIEFSFSNPAKDISLYINSAGNGDGDDKVGEAVLTVIDEAGKELPEKNIDGAGVIEISRMFEDVAISKIRIKILEYVRIAQLMHN